MKSYYYLLTFTPIYLNVCAQVSNGGIPFSIVHELSYESIPLESLPSSNIDSLLMEESVELPYRFAYAHKVNLNLNNSGE